MFDGQWQPLLIDVDQCHTLQEDSRPVRTRLNPRLRPCHRHRQIGVCDSRATKCSLPKPSSRRCRSPCVGDKALARAPQVRAGEKLNNGSDPLPRSGQAHARRGRDAGFSAETLLGLPEMNWERVSAHHPGSVILDLSSSHHIFTRHCR